MRGSFEVRNNVSAIIAKDHFCMCDGDNRQRTCFVCVNVLLGTYMQYCITLVMRIVPTLLSKTHKCLGGYIIVDLYLINSFDFMTIFQTEEYVPTVLNCRKKFSKLNFRVRVLPMVSKRRTVWYTPCPL